ncbi:MAG: hypothetical protein M3Z28_13710 [Candidatus Dormibacteraeota bacterium]|nr:hypothetical protein [Candidatus Dormibacteraeota bacterium]
MRLAGAAGAILLFLSLLGPVILKQLPPLVLLLALGPALLWLTTWIWEGRPPKGWLVKNRARVDQTHRKLRTWTRRHLIIGLVLSVGTLILVGLQIWTRR